MNEREKNEWMKEDKNEGNKISKLINSFFFNFPINWEKHLSKVHFDNSKIKFVIPNTIKLLI